MEGNFTLARRSVGGAGEAQTDLIRSALCVPPVVQSRMGASASVEIVSLSAEALAKVRDRLSHRQHRGNEAFLILKLKWIRVLRNTRARARTHTRTHVRIHARTGLDPPTLYQRFLGSFGFLTLNLFSAVPGMECLRRGGTEQCPIQPLVSLARNQ